MSWKRLMSYCDGDFDYGNPPYSAAPREHLRTDIMSVNDKRLAAQDELDAARARIAELEPPVGVDISLSRRLHSLSTLSVSPSEAHVALDLAKHALANERRIAELEAAFAWMERHQPTAAYWEDPESVRVEWEQDATLRSAEAPTLLAAVQQAMKETQQEEKAE